MKALTILKSAIDQSSIGIIALVLLTPVIFPRLALAAETQTLGQPAQFQIKISQTPKPNDNQNLLSIKTIADNDPLVVNLKQYLEDIDSPLGQYAAEIVQQPQWQRALAISYVESHMGRDCFNNNCSGIGGAPGTPTWRKYPTKLEWFIDLCNLLEKPIYKEKYTTFQKMKGVYVQPGSANWVNGAQARFNELTALTKESEAQSRNLAQNRIIELATLATFPESTN